MMEIAMIWVHMGRVWMAERFVALGIWLMPYDSAEQNKMGFLFSEYKEWKDM